jgi:hypothetical protein
MHNEQPQQRITNQPTDNPTITKHYKLHHHHQQQQQLQQQANHPQP